MFLMTLILPCQGTWRSAAEVRLSGTENQAVLETNNALIGEIAAALQSTFGIKVTLTVTTSQKFTGVYSGSVHQIFSHLLTGKDYILRMGSDGIGVVLLGNSAPDIAARVSQPHTQRLLDRLLRLISRIPQRQ